MNRECFPFNQNERCSIFRFFRQPHTECDVNNFFLCYNNLQPLNSLHTVFVIKHGSMKASRLFSGSGQKNIRPVTVTVDN